MFLSHISLAYLTSQTNNFNDNSTNEEQSFYERNVLQFDNTMWINYIIKDEIEYLKVNMIFFKHKFPFKITVSLPIACHI